MSDQVSVTIAPVEGATVPMIVIGFSGNTFSQAIYKPVPDNPQETVAFADDIYKGIIEQSALAHKNFKAVAGTFSNGE